jgi:hypothetical protein
VTRTRPLYLVILVVIGGLLGYLLESTLVSSGQPIAQPPYSLALVLVLDGAVVVAAAWRIRAAIRNHERHKIDPFYARRIVVLAKTSSIVGSFLLGAGVGILLFLITRTVIAGSGALIMSVATAVAALAMMVCGLIAEQMCSIPPDDRDENDNRGGGDPLHARPE